MNTEKKYTYEELIDLLKDSSHRAPNVWNEIEAELDLGNKISKLPEYKAPDNLWDNISQAMDLEEEITETPTTPSAKVEGSKKWLTLLIGIIIGIVALGIFQRIASHTNAENFKYSSEVEMATLNHTRIEIDDNIDDVLEYIEDNRFMFNEEQLKEFNIQHNEINEALQQLMELQEKYGLDESSNQLMARMERDRTTLLKSMISST